MQFLLGSVLQHFNPQKEEVWDPYKYTNSDIRYRRGNTSFPATQGRPQPEPVMDLKVNPIKDLESHYANVTRAPTLDSYTQIGDPRTNNAYCTNAIPSKLVLDQSVASKELMGLNQAQRTTLPAGSGVPAYKVPETLPMVNELTYGNNSASGIQFNQVSRALYNQDFVSMSAVPAVPVGQFVDPITGVAYDAYESGIPPPDADYYEMTHGNGKNRKFSQLQGGWSQNVPRPEKREILEGDFYMHSNRTINTYGGDDSYGQQLRHKRGEDIERQMRFTLDDSRPDGLDGPILTGVPANTVGIYGTDKVRFVPRLPSTYRGYQEEETFRSGVDPAVAVGHENRSAQHFTHFPQSRSASNYEGPAGPAFRVDASSYRAEVLPQHTQRGTEVYEEATRLPNNGGAEGAAFRAQHLPQLTKRGLEVYEEATRLPNNGGAEGAAFRAQHLPQLTKRGLEVYEEATRQAGNGGAEAIALRADCTPGTSLRGTEVHPEAVRLPNSGGAEASAVRAIVPPQTTINGIEVYSENVRLPNDGGAQATALRADCTPGTTLRGTEIYTETIRLPNNGGAEATALRAQVAPQTTLNGLEVYAESTRKADSGGTEASSYRAETVPQHTQRGTEVYSEVTRQADSGGFEASAHRATVVPQHTQRETSVTDYKGHAHNAVNQGQTYAKSTRKGRLTMLKRIYGAMSNNSDAGAGMGVASRAATTQLSDKKTNPNTAFIPSRSVGGNTNMIRQPNNWASVRFNENHTPSQEYIGNAESHISDGTYMTPNMALRGENNMLRIPTPSHQIGGAHEMIYAHLEEPQTCPVTF